MISQKAMRLLASRLFVLAPLFAIILGGCCTILGAYIGSATMNSPNREAPPNLSTLEPGTWLNVSMNDSTVVSCRFVRLLTPIPAAYSASYEHARLEIMPADTLPALGADIKVTDRSGNTLTAALSGFDLLQDHTPVLEMQSPDHDNPYVIRLPFLRSIEDSTGLHVDPQLIVRLIREKKVPIMTDAIVVVKDDTQTRIDLRDVTSIEKKGSGNGWMIGGLVGLGADVAILLIAVATFRANFRPTFRWN